MIANEWSLRLASKLVPLEKEFHQLVQLRVGDRAEDEVRREKLAYVTYSLLSIVEALREFEIFEYDLGLRPVQEVIHDLHKMTIGGTPALLRPVKGGKGKNGTAKVYVKKHAVVAMRLLQAAGMTQAAASALASRELASGRFDVPAKTIITWSSRMREKYPSAQEQIDKTVREWQLDASKPPTVDEVLRWVRSVVQSPEMQSKR